jgi:hypothetical protein
LEQELSPKVAEWCARLIQADHRDHEDILRNLQAAADPYSIPFLRQAVLLKPSLAYLAYDDYGSYYKKCFWALRAIGTPEAIAVIREFITASDAAARQEAVYRLEQITKAALPQDQGNNASDLGGSGTV